MPIITLTTNIPDEKISNDINQKLTELFAELLSKPPIGFSIIVESNKRLTIGGTYEPAVVLETKSIGSFNEKANIEFSKKISEFIKENLGVASDRCVVHFYNLESHEIGKFGTTIKDKLSALPHNKDGVNVSK